MRILLLLLFSAAAALPATHYLTISGMGGEADYAQRFETWAKDLDKAFRAAGGDVTVHTLYGDAARKDGVEAAIDEIKQSAKSGDSVAVMLIGHGTFDGHAYKVNLPGPDLSGAEIAALLDRLPNSRQLVANMTSASGGSIPDLQGPNRTVITATKSGTQRNAVVFARYWVAAVQDPASDKDKNEVISALEAFEYANRKTQEFYTTQKRLATEHAVIEDTGDGEAVRAPSPENGQGLAARQFALLRIGSTQLAAQDPAKRGLLDKKEHLEQAIDKLKYEKAAMPLDEYRAQLIELLVDLAKTQRAIDAE
jgi:hypothetical protein